MASAASLLCVLLPIAVAAPAHAADGSACGTSLAVAPDAEQARLADARTSALVERGGFGDFVRRFPAALCSARGPAEAGRLLDSWERGAVAVRRAPGPGAAARR
ncbi:hypothetical protein [Streptomyces sp. NPDC046161]|uniref:hypothetical protein n=1 Tax=Streptomyces sp. NPDC046161 TaxID=3155132 RepID=UPI00340495E2